MLVEIYVYSHLNQPSLPAGIVLVTYINDACERVASNVHMNQDLDMFGQDLVWPSGLNESSTTKKSSFRILIGAPHSVSDFF